MAWTSPRTWVAGENVTAALMNVHVRDNLKAIGDAWTSYTPTWSSTGTAPTLGNGTLTGKYIQPGKLVIARVELTIGSTTTAGTNIYTMTLPVAAAATTNTVIGSAFFFDTSAGNYYPGICYMTSLSTTTAAAVFGTARWTAIAPVAPATGDVFSFEVTYEAA